MKKVAYFGYTDYVREFRNGQKVELKKGIITPVTDEVFELLKRTRHLHEVLGETDKVQG